MSGKHSGTGGKRMRKSLGLLLSGALSLSVMPYAPAGAAVASQAEVRFATYNASLNRSTSGELIANLSSPDNQQAATIAEVIQRARPDVVLVNEFDFDAGGTALRLFQDNYLSVPHNGADPITYPYRYTAPSNTGIPSGFDLNNDGSVGGPDDALGFGFFPGQFGMALYSRYPILEDDIRTFQNFLWKDMPGALLPDDDSTPDAADWYSSEELAVLPLSSKSHWDIPIQIGEKVVHVLAAHPTPPVFDGDEDRNGRRNFDEIRFWADYVTPNAGDYIYDDAGGTGGLKPGSRFVIMGDYNSDPFDGDSIPGAAQQILELPSVRTNVTPDSLGGPQQAELQGGANATQTGDPSFDTADFADSAPGNVGLTTCCPAGR